MRTVRSGYVATSSTNSVAVRATVYVQQSSGLQRSLNSTSASDTSAGTGAQKVRVTFLDATANGPFTEDITMNGITAVNMVSTNVCFIESIEVIQVGSGGGNVGTIQLFTLTGGGGSVFSSIAASDNRTFWAHHYIGSGRTCQLAALRASASVTAGQVHLQTAGDPTQTNLPFSDETGPLRHGTTTQPLDFEPPIPIPGPNFIIVNEKPDLITASTAYVTFQYTE